MAFTGVAPETINGRLAMLGFVAAVGAEAVNHLPVAAQVRYQNAGPWEVPSTCQLGTENALQQRKQSILAAITSAKETHLSPSLPSSRCIAPVSFWQAQGTEAVADRPETRFFFRVLPDHHARFHVELYSSILCLGACHVLQLK